VDLAGVPVDLAGVPVDLAGVPVDIAGIPVDLAGVPVYLARTRMTNSQQFRMATRTKKTQTMKTTTRARKQLWKDSQRLLTKRTVPSTSTNTSSSQMS
jgi:hypothetical protein